MVSAQGAAGGGVPVARAHQVAAMAALDEVFASRDRAQLVMACGTGKTLVGRWYAQRVSAAVTVVVVPSLSLVAQTLGEWRAASGWAFEALITCSDPTTADGVGERAAGDGCEVEGPIWARLRARVTTSAAVVAERLSGHSADRALVVFSTYHSVHVVAEAARRAGVVADLVIADESHTLAGWPRQQFRVVLDKQFRARMRLFMTATAVNICGRAAAEGCAGLSMDDETLFGPVAYRLDFADAIAAELLADYRVVVYDTAGQQMTPDPVAALRAAAQLGVGSVLSFHGRVAKARAFSAAIDGTAPGDGRRVVARCVASVDPTRQRSQALSLLSSRSPDELVVISSARCLSAGVDIPAVDGVLFADPKHSEVDVVQAVGRALRRAPGKQFGLVMIPVCVGGEFDDDTVLSTGAFSMVWRILRALRSMDRRLAAEVDELSRRASRRGTSDGSQPARVAFQFGSRAAEQRLRARLVDFVSPLWDNIFHDLEGFVAEHGHARPERGTRLGQWCERQRRAHRGGMLAADRVEQLRGLPGWVWSLAEARWAEQCAQVQAVAQRCGGLALNSSTIAGIALRVPENRYRITTVGRWCARERQLARRGDLAPWQRDALAAIPGWDWSPLSGYDAEAVDLLAEWVAWKGHANPPPDTIEDDLALGQWLNSIRRRRVTGHLSVVLLDEIEVVCPAATCSGALRWYTDETRWLLGLEALRRFAGREGHCRPVSSHIETLPDIEIRLHDWCTRARHLYRHGQLGGHRARLLESVAGWQWEHPRAPRVRADIGRTRHGTRTGYVKGCTCDACTRANSLNEGARCARAAAGQPTTDLVDAAGARAHLQWLQGCGAPIKALARACGLNVKTVAALADGTTSRILPHTEQSIRAITMADVRVAAAPGSQVPAGPTWELLERLIARGWPKAWIARALGMNGGGLQLRRDTITKANADKVAALAARIGDRRPPPRRARQPLPSLAQLLDEHTPTSKEGRVA